MNQTYSFVCLHILFVMYFIHIDYCKVYAEDLRKQESKLHILFEKLHSMYKDAFENEKTYITRRFFTKNGDSHYTLHVQKLKEVDGVKTHNLRLEGKSKWEDPVIYINNPVEARMPNPFLSIDHFKNVMFERVEKQKKEFDVSRNLLINNKQFKVFKHLENFPTEMKKKHVKQVVDVSNNIERTKKNSTYKLMKTTLHNGSNKVNKKRKQKIHPRSTTESTNLPDELIKTVPHKVNKKRAVKVRTSRGGKSTRIPYKITTTKLPKTIADEEIITKTKTDEKITTESTADEDITTETTADQEINTETIADEKITTETPVDEKITTETASNKKNTTQTTVDHEITEETTQMVDNKEIIKEIIAKEEIITEPVTTTESTVRRTTRTKQLRPFVFVGDR